MRAHRGRPRRAARRDGQPHLASEPRVPRLPAARSGLTVGRPVPDARQGLAGWRARDEDVAQIFLRKPGAPFSTITIEETGKPERIWTTFGSADWAEQVDLDVNASATRALITGWLGFLASHGVRIVRLDAVGYVIKKPGTTCFMVEPEIYEFLAWVTGVAATMGLVVLPEVHDRYGTHVRLAEHGHWTYDFVLPGLVLQAFGTRDARQLAAHLAARRPSQFTTLDCHDGIPVRPDLDGILTRRKCRTSRPASRQAAAT